MSRILSQGLRWSDGDTELADFHRPDGDDGVAVDGDLEDVLLGRETDLRSECTAGIKGDVVLTLPIAALFLGISEKHVVAESNLLHRPDW